MKVIGVARKSGSFSDQRTGQTITYDNAVILCTLSPEEMSKDLDVKEGEIGEVVKMPWAKFEACASRYSLKSVLGKDLKFYYNQYRKVDGFELLRQ